MTKPDCLDYESVVRSNQLLRQLSDLIDGLVNLSAPFRDSSVASDESSEWTPLDYIEKLVAMSGSERTLRNPSMSR